jgi:anti-sigma factor RsiW
MSGTDLTAGHLDDAALQALADGTLRGPEGFAAHEHCDACEACAKALASYAALVGSLSALRDPPLPADFTAHVLEAAGHREAQLAARRQHRLAAVSTAAVALLALLGWAMSAGPAQRVNEVISSVALVRQLWSVALPVAGAARLPLMLGAFAVCAAILMVLARALRVEPRTSGA